MMAEFPVAIAEAARALVEKLPLSLLQQLDELAGDRISVVGSKRYGSKYRVREDQWYDDYMGAVSEMELATRVFEILSHNLYQRQVIGELLQHDPELVNFAVGFLLRFEP